VDGYANPSPLAITPYESTQPISILTNALIKPNTGINLLSASYVGQDTQPLTSNTAQAGTYTGFSFQDQNTSLALPDGILLTSGSALNALGPNNSSSVTTGWATGLTGDPQLGDPQLNALLPSFTTFDANSLTLHFTVDPGVTTIQFKFVFASEEFPEWVGLYNDIFAAFLDGQQISFDPAGLLISVDSNYFNLNNAGNFTNSNTKGKTVVGYDVQYDGLTPVLTTQAALNQSFAEHTLKFAIADTRDPVLDSGIFLSSLSGNATGGTGTGEAPEADAGGPYTVAPGGSVQLSGSGTTDAGQDPNTLTYQ
jgi:hypothetical protein